MPTPGFTAQTVPPSQIRTIYPLVREAIPGLELAAFLSFARRITDPRHAQEGGIVAVTRRGRALPCGAFLYRCQRDLAAGPVLVVEHFVAVDVLDPAPVMRALVDELDALAVRLGCGGIQMVVAREHALLRAGLEEAGHSPRGLALWKPVPPRSSER